jgi:hypothetical protein
MNQERLATLINTYHDIVRRSPRRQPSWWGFIRYFVLTRHEVEDRRMSLHHLEGEIRKSGDPRIHFALNCGAASCPAIRAYEAEALDRQLEMATRVFLADPAGCRIEVETRTLHLSRLFHWYRRDFEDPVSFLHRHLEPDRAADLLALGPSPRIRYQPWDWTPVG